MAKTKKKTDGKTSQVPQRDSRETHQVPDNPPYPIRDSIGDRNPTLPDLHRSGRLQAATSDTLGNGDSSDQVRAEFQITSEDREGDFQTNRKEDYKSIRKSSDLTPLEGSRNRRIITTPDERDVLGANTPQESEADTSRELSERRLLRVKKLEQELYLAAERLRKAQDEDLEHDNSRAHSRQSNQHGLTIEDENIILAMQRLHSPTRGSNEESNEFNARISASQRLRRGIEDPQRAEWRKSHQRKELRAEIDELWQEKEINEHKQPGAVKRDRRIDRSHGNAGPDGEMRRREHYREWLATQVVLDSMCEGDIMETGFSNIPARDK